MRNHRRVCSLLTRTSHKLKQQASRSVSGQVRRTEHINCETMHLSGVAATCVTHTHTHAVLCCPSCCLLPNNEPTQVTFVPDAAVFSPGINFDADTVASRLRELAFLNAGATMKLRLLKHGQPLPTSKVAKQAAAAADKAQRRSKRSTSQEAVADGSNGDSAAAAAADAGGVQQDWQVFCFQDGLKEYVQW